MKPLVLIADDEIGIRELLKELLKKECDIITAEDGIETIKQLNSASPDILLLDIRMPKKNGLEVLKYINENKIPVKTIIITADRDINSAIQAMKLGAYDYIIKPFETEKILKTVRNAIERSDLEKEVKKLRSEVQKKYSFKNIVGTSKAIREVFALMEKVIDNNSTVLIVGESGTGKELIARAIHYNGPRKDYPFVAVDCASIPDTLIESELFGYEKGAFTGALSRKIGKFELAGKGTLFLDEIGNLKLEIQAKLLRVLQEREFTRVGGNEKIELQARIITATNADLEQLIKEGKFREDLYYRLNVVPIYLPPLRERKEDIPLLTRYFLNKFNNEYGKKVKIEPSVIDYFMNYSWPGNVRELENTIQRLVIVSDNELITVDDLPAKIKDMEGIKKESGIKVGMTLEEVEKEFIKQTLKSCNYVIAKAARILGITRKTLHTKLKKYNIKIPGK